MALAATEPAAVDSGSVQESIEEMVALEQREKIRMSFSDHIADHVTSISGSMAFVWLNAIWFTTWICANTFGLVQFDPFPFGLLTMIVSLEAIGLAIFVLISENRQAELADRRAKLDLQINLISEREITKLIEMVARVEQKLGIAEGSDPDAVAMRRPTHVHELADRMEEYERVADKDAAAGPASAADTEV
jgi:uncharacterized membrane protein